MILKGVGIGRGVAVSPVLRMAEPLPEPKDEPRAASVSAEAENARVTKALAAVNADLNRRAQEAANGDEGTKQAAEILQAVAMFASDPALAANIAKMVDDGKTGERAVLEGFGQVEEMFRQIGGYQGERAADLHDVGQRVIAELMGRPAPGVPQSETPFVLVAKDLSPADTASLDLDKTLAIVTSEGGPTSHTAILCRARGIVAVVSAAEAVDLTDGETVIVNAARGEVTTDPTDEQLAAAHDAKLRADKAKELRGQPGQLKDGHRIPLLANVGKPSDAKTALEYGAEGVGLFRTEFLFIGNEEPPTVEEQTKAYAELLAHSVEAATRDTYGAGPLVRYRANVVVPPRTRYEILALKGIAVHFLMEPREHSSLHGEEQRIITDLVDVLMADAPEPSLALEPVFWEDWANAASDGERLRVAVDQVASLTDGSAMTLHELLCS